MTVPAASPGSTTRARLLEAAVELLVQGGFDAVTTRSVAGRAGVNSALVNYHFQTKQRLLVEAATIATMRIFAEPAELLLGSPSPGEGVRAAIEWLARMDARAPELSVVSETTVRALRDEELREAVAGELTRFRASLVERIEGPVAAAELPAGLDASGLAIVIAAVLDGLALHVLLDPGLDLDAASRTLSTLLAPRERVAGDR